MLPTAKIRVLRVDKMIGEVRWTKNNKWKLRSTSEFEAAGTP